MKKSFFNRMIAAVAAVALVLNLASCSGADEPEMLSPYGEGANVTDVTVTYEYSVPEELLGYVDIYPCVNNDAATDMLPSHAMKESCFSHTYHVSKFPMETIFAVEFKKPSERASGKDVDWTISTDITVSMMVNGKPVIEHIHEDYLLYGDLLCALRTYANSRLDHTFAVKVWKNGYWEYRN